MIAHNLYFFLVEGKTGKDKYFATKTLINITRLITQQHASDMASSPTGCAPDLIGGYTYCWCCSIKTGRNFQMTPKIIETKNTKSLISTRIYMCNVVSRFMNEHSMTGRPYWVCLKHRHE